MQDWIWEEKNETKPAQRNIIILSLHTFYCENNDVCDSRSTNSIWFATTKAADTVWLTSSQQPAAKGEVDTSRVGASLLCTIELEIRAQIKAKIQVSFGFEINAFESCSDFRSWIVFAKITITPSWTASRGHWLSRAWFMLRTSNEARAKEG